MAPPLLRGGTEHRETGRPSTSGHAPSFPKRKDHLAAQGWVLLSAPSNLLGAAGAPLIHPFVYFLLPACFSLQNLNVFNSLPSSNGSAAVQLPPIPPCPPPRAPPGHPAFLRPVRGDLLGRAGLINSSCPRGPGSCLPPPPLPGSAPPPQSLGLTWWDPGGTRVRCHAWGLFSPTSGTPRGLVPAQGALLAPLGALQPPARCFKALLPPSPSR